MFLNIIAPTTYLQTCREYPIYRPALVVAVIEWLVDSLLCGEGVSSVE